MTRPGYVMVEFPIEEAEALVAPEDEMPTAWSDSLRRDARLRLRKAIAIERGPGGNAEQPAPDVEQVGKAA